MRKIRRSCRIGLKYQKNVLWKSLWKLWITPCRKQLLKELCELIEESGKMSEKVGKSIWRGSFCQFSEEKDDTVFVENRVNDAKRGEIFCKSLIMNTICIAEAPANCGQKEKKFRKRC